MSVIFKFTSGTRTGLFAFAGDRAGALLPEKHGPWIFDGNVQPHEAIPHKLDRQTVENAIDDHGYQLWRMKRRQN